MDLLTITQVKSDKKEGLAAPRTDDLYKSNMEKIHQYLKQKPWLESDVVVDTQLLNDLGLGYQPEDTEYYKAQIMVLRHDYGFDLYVGNKDTFNEYIQLMAIQDTQGIPQRINYWKTLPIILKNVKKRDEVDVDNIYDTQKHNLVVDIGDKGMELITDKVNKRMDSYYNKLESDKTLLTVLSLLLAGAMVLLINLSFILTIIVLLGINIIIETHHQRYKYVYIYDEWINNFRTVYREYIKSYLGDWVD